VSGSNTKRGKERSTRAYIGDLFAVDRTWGCHMIVTTTRTLALQRIQLKVN